jgi:hypothetical protein
LFQFDLMSPIEKKVKINGKKSDLLDNLLLLFGGGFVGRWHRQLWPFGRLHPVRGWGRLGEGVVEVEHALLAALLDEITGDASDEMNARWRFGLFGGGSGHEVAPGGHPRHRVVLGVTRVAHNALQRLGADGLHG